MSWFVRTECQFSLKGKGCVWKCGVQKLFLWSFFRGVQRVALFEVRVETLYFIQISICFFFFSHFYIMEWLIKMKNVLCCVQPVHLLADKSVMKPCERNGPVDVSLAFMLGKA